RLAAPGDVANEGLNQSEESSPFSPLPLAVPPSTHMSTGVCACTSVCLRVCAFHEPPPIRYNEVSFYALNIIHPVTHALGNTLKRVVMIIVSVLVLNHRFTPLGLAGCTTAIGGVMAYSLTKARLEQAGVVVPVGKVAAVKVQLENEAGVSVPVGKAAEVAVAVVAAAKNKKEGATGEEDGGTAAE
ncbi:unnamed protein product, partial [Ectocarpus sp. 13 AM-2016]